eukprot:gene3822-biopygen3253
MPSGLTIYKSHFKNADGSYGVIGGPHEVFTQIEKYHHLSNSKSFLSNQYYLYKMGYQVNPDVSVLGFPDNSFDISSEIYEEDDLHHTFLSRQVKTFYEVENAGSEINYRCVKCRSCTACKNHDHEEALSIKEEVEQELINHSVNVDKQNCVTIANLPFIHSPILKLTPNRDKALKVYSQQIKRLSKSLEDKETVIKSEGKLQALGYVEYVKNLPKDIQISLANNPMKNFIPWRVVWKANSTTTPSAVVFDASQPTASGYSLNNIIAKGRNNMNKLIEIFVRWRMHKIAFHTDVQKIYNAIKLREEDWCYQRYLWQEQLDPAIQPEEKVMMTLIYGVKSSGNQAECGLRDTASKFQDTYPEVHEIVNKDINVDDCMSGCPSRDLAMQRVDELELVLNRGGFSLKGRGGSRKNF